MADLSWFQSVLACFSNRVAPTLRAFTGHRFVLIFVFKFQFQGFGINVGNDFTD